MAMMLELEAGDQIRVPPNSGALITVQDKTGKRTRVRVESALPVEVIKQKAQAAISRPAIPQRVRPTVATAPVLSDTPAKS